MQMWKQKSTFLMTHLLQIEKTPTELHAKPHSVVLHLALHEKNVLSQLYTM